MKVLMCGDVVGRAGRDAVLKYVPLLREQLQLDLVVVNGENAAHGFGLSEKICHEFFSAGVHVITSGNHVFGQRTFLREIEQLPEVIRPLNYPASTPGKGYTIFQTKKKKKILIINVMGNVFMDALNLGFPAVEAVVQHHPLKEKVDAILVDVHAEATSEKNAMGYFLDGRVSAVVGTHTHIPTADTRILPQGTAYQTDLGMCGDYDSVVGFNPDVPIKRFMKEHTSERLSPAEKAGTLSGIFIEISDETGLATGVKPIVRGSNLINF